MEQTITEMSSFGEFYAEAHGPMLAAVVVAFGDPEIAADAVAEAFTRAFERWDQVRQLASPLLGYLPLLEISNGGVGVAFALSARHSRGRYQRRSCLTNMFISTCGVQFRISQCASAKPSEPAMSSGSPRLKSR